MSYTPLSSSPNAGGTPRATPDRHLQAIQRKLDAWELAHLRELASEQDELISSLQDNLNAERDQRARADEVADYWRENVLRLEEDLSLIHI